MSYQNVKILSASKATGPAELKLRNDRDSLDRKAPLQARDPRETNLIMECLSLVGRSQTVTKDLIMPPQKNLLQLTC